MKMQAPLGLVISLPQELLDFDRNIILSNYIAFYKEALLKCKKLSLPKGETEKLRTRFKNLNFLYRYGVLNPKFGRL